MIDKFRDNFREEAYELLNNIEASLLELEEQPENAEEISAVFRTMHTIKGSAAMFGFQQISNFAHEVETALDLLREGRLEVTPRLISLTLEARDHIRSLLEYDSTVPEDGLAAGGQIIAGFHKLAESAESTASNKVADGNGTPGEQGITVAEVREAAFDLDKPAASADDGELDHYVTFRIRFKPSADIYANGTNPLLLLRELEEMGEFTCVPFVADIPRLSDFDPEKCIVHWDVLLTTKKRREAVQDVFIFVEDSSDVQVVEIDDLSSLDTGEHKRLGEILTERGVVDLHTVNRTARKQRRIGELLVENGLEAEEVEAAYEEQQHVERTRQRVQKELASSSIRVNSEKLDTLVDLVGEIVTLQARLTQTSAELKIPTLTSLAENFERLTDELRDSTMSIRMLPIGTTFSKFKRLVRDLSNDLGKEVEIVTEGGETELDKTVIERLNDPLVHMIRNSIDHGIEQPETRTSAGKPRVGRVHLSALHTGATVTITVEDDGAGVNREAVLDRAIQRGLVSPGAELSDHEVDQLLFAPGFSTSSNVTQVSGRGVGMDVVRKEIESLGGSVRVESETGRFTRITLTIPLTLAIIDGLLVKIGSEHFVFPLQSVEECIELTISEGEKTEGESLVTNRGELLPYVRLREQFSVSGGKPEIEQIVVVNSNEGKVGFVVDHVVGDLQTVIKNLGKLYKNVEGISGGTILGDGSVALILDVQKLSAVAAAATEAGA